MLLTNEKILEINAAYIDEMKCSDKENKLGLHLEGTTWFTSVYSKGGWQICRLGEIEDLVSELLNLSYVVSQCTGIVDI